mmetsp:Transcript_5085/g.19057  ORF Transcript_5085/g.19057 Transcript_5085/m.19057 type:complete len:1202 (-) Transcript_5085:2161-5766(-)
MTQKYVFLETTGSSLMKCQNKETGQIVAIKTYRYNDHLLAKHLIRILKKCKHNANIMDFNDVFKRKKRICIVLEYLPRRLLSVIKDHASGIPEEYVKLLMFQLLNALRELHSYDIAHRDIKPEKVLLEADDVHVKLGGFGLARRVEDQMTPHVTTSWYRAPEVICEQPNYGCPIDVWGAGLVMAELLDGRPLLPGDNESNMLLLMQNILGSFSEDQKRHMQRMKIQPNAQTARFNNTPLEKRYREKVSKHGMQLLKSMLRCDPNERRTAEQCLKSPWFDGINVEKLMGKYRNSQPSDVIGKIPTSLSQQSKAHVGSQGSVPPVVSSSANPSQSNQHSSKSKRRFPVRINGNHKIQIGSNSNHVAISLHRIPKIKASDKTKYNLPSLGMLPIHRVDDYLETVPAEWKRLGGIFVPLHQSEALKLVFENQYNADSHQVPPKALKVAHGSINAISGQAWKRESKHPSDHMLIYKRDSLEGILNDNFDLHQFTSLPLNGDADFSCENSPSETMQVVMYETKMSAVQNAPQDDHAKGSSTTLPNYHAPISSNMHADPRSGVLPNIKRDTSTAGKNTRSRRKKGLSKYEILETVGEGTYGVVMKARDRETMQIVAIKKFKDSEYDDEAVRKTTQREKKILKMLKQGNIIQLKENFKRKGKMYLVFEYVPKNLLEVLEEHENGFEPELIRVYMYQIIKAIEYCHNADIIHRDVKLENLLLHPDHTLKLCDFGFARTVSKNNTETPYVSTRWYRAPELLVNAEYGKPVDIWAIGCIMGEIADGKPLFPGTTDLDQLFLIQNIEGEVPPAHIEAFYKKYRNYKFPKRNGRPLNVKERYGDKLDEVGVNFMETLLKLDPHERADASSLLKHPYFDGFDIEDFIRKQQERLEKEASSMQVTGDPSELPKLLTNWNQGSARPSHHNFEDNLTMRPPIAPLPAQQQQAPPQQQQKKQQPHTQLVSLPPPVQHTSPSTSPLKKQLTQPHVHLGPSNSSKQKTPRTRNDRLFTHTKLPKQDSFATPKLSMTVVGGATGPNRRRSSVTTPEEFHISNSFSKPQSRSSSRQSSRQSSRRGTRNKKKAGGNKESTRPPLPGGGTNAAAGQKPPAGHSHQQMQPAPPQQPPPQPQQQQQKYEHVIDFTKFGRFYIHIVNSEQYKLITGFAPDHESIGGAVYQQLGIPWHEEYSETALGGGSSARPPDELLSHGFIKGGIR